MSVEILNPDEIREGDMFAPHATDGSFPERERVVAVDVMDEAPVPAEDGSTETRMTVGFETDACSYLRSYEVWGDRDFRVFRPAENLTEEELAEVRGR